MNEDLETWLRRYEKMNKGQMRMRKIRSFLITTSLLALALMLCILALAIVGVLVAVITSVQW